MFGDVEFVALDGFAESLRGLIDDVAETRDARDSVQGQAEAIHAIEHGHVEGSGGGAFFDVAADVNVVVIAAAVSQAMNERGIAVEGEDDRLVGGEEGIEIFVGQAVGMLRDGLQSHEVDYIDYADAKIGYVFTEQGDGSENFQGGNISGAGHDDIG